MNAIAWWSPEFSDGREHYFDRQGEYVPSVDRKVLRFQKEGNIIQWGTAFPWEVLTRRLDSWGINTLGAWTEDPQLKRRQRPYTVILMHEEKEGRFGFNGRDGFDSRFGEKLREVLSERYGWTLNDPMCIGYFIDNELAFGGIVKAVFGAEPDQPAKLEFVKDLKAKYGTIEALNKVWGSSYADWDGLLESKAMPEGKGFRKDADAFNNKFIERYFELSRKGIKSLAPHRLYLGCRFVGFRHAEAVRRIAAKYSDVISINSYHNSIANVSPDQFFGKPMLIGEFHFGTYDRGMFSASLCPVWNQQERAVSYQRYLQGALSNPAMIGAHWFQFRDQPLTGRWDGEGYQIGFVDVADTPYPKLTKAAREVGENMYSYRENGKLTNSMNN